MSVDFAKLFLTVLNYFWTSLACRRSGPTLGEFCEPGVLCCFPAQFLPKLFTDNCGDCRFSIKMT